MFMMTLRKCGFGYLSREYQAPVVKLFARDGIVWFAIVLRARATKPEQKRD